MLFEFSVNTWDDGARMLKEALNTFEGIHLDTKSFKIDQSTLKALQSVDLTELGHRYAEKMDEWYDKSEKANSGYSGLKSKAEKYKRPH
jgi:hypothetical protein